MVAGVRIQFLPKALSGILRGYLIAFIVVSVRNTEFETLTLNLDFRYGHGGAILVILTFLDFLPALVRLVTD